VDEQNNIYLTETYTYETRTKIATCTAIEAGFRIALLDNIFHPQGGGQPRDRGWVDGVPATPLSDPDSPWIQLDLLCESDAGRSEFSVGQEVTASIDAEQRRLFAALHTAGHLVDALVAQLGVRHVASNHFPGQARVEYELDGKAIDKEHLAGSLQEGIDKAVAQGHPVTSGEQDGRRVITLEGLSTEFCAGTHVTDLSRLADVAIRSVKVKSGRLKVGYEAVHASLA
jgi:Ser-tRNA(Ala) deacylase AlaX